MAMAKTKSKNTKFKVFSCVTDKVTQPSVIDIIDSPDDFVLRDTLALAEKYIEEDAERAFTDGDFCENQTVHYAIVQETTLAVKQASKTTKITIKNVKKE